MSQGWVRACRQFMWLASRGCQFVLFMQITTFCTCKHKPNLQVKAKKTVCITPKSLLFSIFFFGLITKPICTTSLKFIMIQFRDSHNFFYTPRQTDKWVNVCSQTESFFYWILKKTFENYSDIASNNIKVYFLLLPLKTSKSMKILVVIQKITRLTPKGVKIFYV